MKKSEQKWSRMASYLAGEMDMNEEISFRNQLESNRDGQLELKQMEKSWKYIHEHSPQGDGDSRKAWNKLYNRLEGDGLLDQQMAGTGKRNFSSALKFAATVLLILAIGIPSLYLGILRDDHDESTLHQFSEKGVSTVDLPDGSRAFLNEGAEITYPGNFENGRGVILNGEAFFEVMSDPVNPFTVRSGKVVISVLGTSFNVKKRGHTDDVEVFVESGRVRVTLERSGEFITLEPGEIGQTGGSALSIFEQSDPNYISWKTKDFKFVDEELINVLRELEESYHVMIHAEDVALAEMRITSTYREQSIDAILETIGAAFGLTVSKNEDQYYLKN